MFPLPQLQSKKLPMTPIPRQPLELPNPIHDSQPSNANTPPNLTTDTDKGKIAQFATKIKETIGEMIPIAHSQNQKEKDTRTRIIY